MKMNNYFYDTCSLLNIGKDLFNEERNIFISSITIAELENIKTSAAKDQETKFIARQIINQLETHTDKYQIVIYKTSMGEVFKDLSLELTNDLKILACAYNLSQEKDLYFVTNDLTLKQFALMFFPQDRIISVGKPQSKYTGFKEVVPTGEQLSLFYQDTTDNIFDCEPNQYIILKNKQGEIEDVKLWTGEEYRYLRYKEFTSPNLGVIKPFNNDVYQKILFDCLTNNQLTLIKGSAGTGKSLIALGYLFYLLDKSKINKIIIFCNTVATANSARLGFLPGDREQKLLDSQIGNFLISKLGGRDAITQLIDQDKLLLLPMSDIRGFDTSGMHAGIYITEGQNMDISLLKLALQRIGEDSICIIDGDNEGQVDLPQYAGINNGMRRMSEVFRGQPFYGEVTLQNIYRSKIAEIANNM